MNWLDFKVKRSKQDHLSSDKHLDSYDTNDIFKVMS